VRTVTQAHTKPPSWSPSLRRWHRLAACARKSRDDFWGQIAVARPAKSIRSQLVHCGLVAHAYELHVLVSPEDRHPAGAGPNHERIPFFRMHGHNLFQPVAILDELDRPHHAPQVLGQREEVGLISRMPFAVTKRIDFFGAAVARLVPANVIPGPPDRFFKFRILHVLTLTRRGDRKRTIDQKRTNVGAPWPLECSCAPVDFALQST
jgi:hypothetical protein